MGSTTAVRRHGAVLAAAAAAAAGIASAVGLWLVLRSAPSQAAAARFCHDRADMVSVMAQAEVLGIVRSLNAFVSTAPAVTPALLEQYLARVKPNPKTVFSVNFYERIPADKRAEWEAIYNTSIYSSDANLNYGPRDDDPNGYWPMVYLRASPLRFPSGLPKNVIGYDPSGEPTRNAVVLEAIAQPSQPFLTPPLLLSGSDGSKLRGFLVFLVAMKRALTPSNFSTASMVAASLSVQDLFSDLATGEFALHLEDGTTSLIDAPDADRTALVPSLAASATIQFANRRWNLTCTPRATYGESTYHYGAWLASSGAMAAGAVLASVLVTLHGLFGRRRRAERSIHARMCALQERAQAYLRAIPSPLILLNAAGQVLGLNEHARDLFATRERQVDVRRVIQVECDEPAACGVGDKSGPSSPVLGDGEGAGFCKGVPIDTHGPLFRPGVAAVQVRRADGSTYPADLCASDLVSLRGKAERAAAAATTTTCSPLRWVSQTDSDTSTDMLLSPTDTEMTLTAAAVAPAPPPEPVVPPTRPGVAQVVLLSDMSERSARLAELEGATAALQRAYLDHGSMILWLCHELRNPLATLGPAVERDPAMADAVATMLGAIEDAGALLAGFEAEPARDADQDHGGPHDVPLNQVVDTAIAAQAPVAAAKHVRVLVASYASSDSVVSRHLQAATAHLVRHLVALAVAAARPRSTVHLRVDAHSVSATATPADLAAAVAIGPRRAQTTDSRQFQDATSLLDLHAMAIDHAIARVPGAAWRRVAEPVRVHTVRWQVVALGGVRWRESLARGPADRG
ncbi:hypothetical protein AMAG_01144 [Allomyces macrogynus ATCC 38327]|uniref:CHASE domain-containing protein n=1 Tax=Allomyces macrogynus (strain ATCC 38327) TaxID=578462 RepID=A0A0L0RYJ7_ALLM3|nr:hypothetical protein AMAG_01144 [Allomyces macrogynus ATCC 38327]|eukprot:KNE55230.1 hypothetical protein AMAG_01144 [Allomyces macrogynus ATCC 38327]